MACFFVNGCVLAANFQMAAMATAAHIAFVFFDGDISDVDDDVFRSIY